MSEENKNENVEAAATAPETTATPTTAETPVEEKPVQETAEPANPEVAEVPSEAAPAEAAEQPAEIPAEETPTQPQIIVQRERGFAHYVGFALLCVLSICFYFIPGIALTYAVNLIPGVSLGAVAAWIFSAILSVIVWFIFKLKIKGFKKSFYFYIGLCVVVLAILIAAEVLTENTNVFSSIFGLLCGAS